MCNALFLTGMLNLQRQASERVLQKLQEHPDAWTRVDSVLEHSKSQQAKYYALQACHASIAARASTIQPVHAQMLSPLRMSLKQQQPALLMHHSL